MLPEITKEQALWLLNDYAPKRGYRVDNNTFDMFLKAYNLLKGTNKVVQCRSCEMLAIAKIAGSLYGQYEEDIKAIATKTTRGRKKNAV